MNIEFQCYLFGPLLHNTALLTSDIYHPKASFPPVMYSNTEARVAGVKYRRMLKQCSLDSVTKEPMVTVYSSDYATFLRERTHPVKKKSQSVRHHIKHGEIPVVKLNGKLFLSSVEQVEEIEPNLNFGP